MQINQDEYMRRIRSFDPDFDERKRKFEAEANKNLPIVSRLRPTYQEEFMSWKQRCEARLQYDEEVPAAYDLVRANHYTDCWEQLLHPASDPLVRRDLKVSKPSAAAFLIAQCLLSEAAAQRGEGLVLEQVIYAFPRSPAQELVCLIDYWMDAQLSYEGIVERAVYPVYPQPHHWSEVMTAFKADLIAYFDQRRWPVENLPRLMSYTFYGNTLPMQVVDYVFPHSRA